MDPHEKEILLADLESGDKVLMDALRDVTEDLAARSPAPGRWSVLESVEHLAVSEEYLFGQIEASHRVEAPMVNKAREAQIAAVGRDRSKKIQSPDVGKPAGRFSTLTQAVERFQAARKKTIQFTESCAEDLRCKVTTHPMIAGPVNCYEILLMIAAHPHRHAQQIEEIKAALHAKQPA